MKYYIIFCFFFYVLLVLGSQNSSGVLTDVVYTPRLLSMWDIGTNFINLCKHPETFNLRFLVKSCTGEHGLGLKPPTLNRRMLLMET